MAGGKITGASGWKPWVDWRWSVARIVDTEFADLFSRVVIVIDGVSFRQHPLMENSRNENAARLAPEKHDMLALFDTAQAWADVIAGTPGRRVVSQPLAARFKVVDVTQGLVRTPLAQGVRADVHEVCSGKPG